MSFFYFFWGIVFYFILTGPYLCFSFSNQIINLLLSHLLFATGHHICCACCELCAPTQHTFTIKRKKGKKGKREGFCQLLINIIQCSHIGQFSHILALSSSRFNRLHLPNLVAPTIKNSLEATKFGCPLS